MILTAAKYIDSCYCYQCGHLGWFMPSTVQRQDLPTCCQGRMTSRMRAPVRVKGPNGRRSQVADGHWGGLNSQ